MGLTILKGFKIDAHIEEISMVWKVTLGMKHPVGSLLQLPDVELSAAGGVAVGDELDGQPDLALGQVGSAAAAGRLRAELLDEPAEEDRICVIFSLRCSARHLVRATFNP